MKIHWNIEQGTPEWLALRTTYFTASELGAWIVEEPEFRWTKEQIGTALTLPAEFVRKSKKEELVAMLHPDIIAENMTYTGQRDSAWQNALESKLAASSRDEQPEFDTWEMRRGRELEPVARAEYEQVTGFGVGVPGFISHDSDGFGCSPDGLVPMVYHADVTPWSHGLEIKCPVAKTMLRWIREGLADGALPDEHKLQVHACLAVTGLDRWDFLAHHPEFRPQIISVMRDDFTRRVEQGLLKLSDDFSEYKAKIGKYLR